MLSHMTWSCCAGEGTANRTPAGNVGKRNAGFRFARSRSRSRGDLAEGYMWNAVFHRLLDRDWVIWWSSALTDKLKAWESRFKLAMAIMLSSCQESSNSGIINSKMSIGIPMKTVFWDIKSRERQHKQHIHLRQPCINAFLSARSSLIFFDRKKCKK